MVMATDNVPALRATAVMANRRCHITTCESPSVLFDMETKSGDNKILDVAHSVHGHFRLHPDVEGACITVTDDITVSSERSTEHRNQEILPLETPVYAAEFNNATRTAPSVSPIQREAGHTEHQPIPTADSSEQSSPEQSSAASQPVIPDVSSLLEFVSVAGTSIQHALRQSEPRRGLDPRRCLAEHWRLLSQRAAHEDDVDAKDVGVVWKPIGKRRTNGKLIHSHGQCTYALYDLNPNESKYADTCVSDYVPSVTRESTKASSSTGIGDRSPSPKEYTPSEKGLHSLRDTSADTTLDTNGIDFHGCDMNVSPGSRDSPSFCRESPCQNDAERSIHVREQDFVTAAHLPSSSKAGSLTSLTHGCISPNAVKSSKAPSDKTESRHKLERKSVDSEEGAVAGTSSLTKADTVHCIPLRQRSLPASFWQEPQAGPPPCRSLYENHGDGDRSGKCMRGFRHEILPHYDRLPHLLFPVWHFPLVPGRKLYSSGATNNGPLTAPGFDIYNHRLLSDGSVIHPALPVSSIHQPYAALEPPIPKPIIWRPIATRSAMFPRYRPYC